jgi:MoxR-like ATPase
MVPQKEWAGEDLKLAGSSHGNYADVKKQERKEKTMAIKQLKGQEALSNIIAEVSEVVIGKDEIKELLLVALLSRGHVLIEGRPGTAKTTIARTFAGTIGGVFKRVQGTPDMLPSDILGFYLYRTDGSSTFIPGPIFANVLLTDELNRTTPRTQAALLQAMQEQQVTIERETFDLEQPFIVIASQIPFGSPGTSPLSDVQKDRFMFRIWSATSSLEEEDLILKNIDAISEPHIKAVTTPQDIIQFQEKVKKVYVADSIRYYILQIIDQLRHHQDIQAGPSTRAGIALLTGARSLAFIRGREFVIPDDVKALLIPSLSHRLQITAEAEMEDISPESTIKEVSTQVPVPKMNHE